MLKVTTAISMKEVMIIYMFQKSSQKDASSNPSNCRDGTDPDLLLSSHEGLAGILK